jgi:hypothetical protein
MELMMAIIGVLSTYLLLRTRWNPELPILIYVPISLVVWCKGTPFILNSQNKERKKRKKREVRKPESGDDFKSVTSVTFRKQLDYQTNTW